MGDTQFAFVIRKIRFCTAAGGNPNQPTAAETAAVCKKVARYQAIFNTH